MFNNNNNNKNNKIRKQIDLSKSTSVSVCMLLQAGEILV